MSALSLGRQDARAPVAHFFVRNGGPSRWPTRKSGRVRVPLTQEQIADVLGLTAVHVNRTMRQLREEGLIVVENR